MLLGVILIKEVIYNVYSFCLINKTFVREIKSGNRFDTLIISISIIFFWVCCAKRDSIYFRIIDS